MGYSDRAFVVDVLTLSIISVAIGAAADELTFMSAFVPLVLLGRFGVWALLPIEERGHSVAAEVVFFGFCTALGAFNDWNSVVNHQIYDYTVPHYFPGFSSIPLWMLLFWGMILRGLTSLCQWHRIGLDQPRNEVRLGWTNANSWVLKLVLQLALVLVTRQFIYRLYLDPLLSWMPFAVALVLFVLLFGINRQERRIVLIMAIVGPLVEVLYIQVGHLHAYHHGWIGGVPLWIALWWVVGILIWSDLSRRTLRMMRSYESSSSAGTPVRILAP